MSAKIGTAFLPLLTSVTIVCTVLQYLSGLLVCRKIIERRSTDDLYAFQFLFGFLLCSMGLKYGILIENHALITVNAIGTFLSICYCFVFLKYAVNVRSVYYQALACIFVLTSTLMYVDCWDEDQKIAGEHIGYVNCTISAIFFMASCYMMRDVFRTKSSSALPFPLVLSSFIVSMEWFLFGHLNNDNFIKVPSFFWTVLAGFQLSLIYIYPCRLRALNVKAKSDIC